ncbi:Serine/threonine protein kinase [Micromonospora pallida]|uniref:non-specific serine/threonine protein kinase n=1 Tax=Micromonospora pallida TaxID=145854 RepID=A0A1C6SBU6_9ACTN|nr:serine/threonine-protein kinase [Micromonospora pallida]SCL26909.1 Serine/threonine protein kinase [Micromonospora pallida]
MSNGQHNYVGPPDAPDRYELIERHAAGGEGEVWRAREHHGDVTFSYAVKVLRVPAEDPTDRGLEGLRLQAALATQLEHPALVKVKEVFVGPPPHLAGAASTDSAPRLYFVMKWIEGRSLQELLESGEVRGLDVLTPLQPIAAAVDYLHSGQDTDGVPVLHRDIKPANILVSGSGRAYLVDFGLVRLNSTSGTARVYGTAPFMAPECLARGEYTPATDRYALGATVYYAVTGEMPVPGDIDGMTQRLTAVLGPGQDRVIRGMQSMVAVTAERRPAAAAAWIRALSEAPPETSIQGARQPALPPAPGPAHPPPPPTAGPSGYPLPPGSPTAPTSGAPGRPSPAGYPLPPTSGAPGSPPSGNPASSDYPLPPGPRPSTAGPSHYPLPPNSGAGFPGAPGQARKKSKVPLVLAIVATVLLAACCIPTGWSLVQGELPGGLSASPTPSVDRATPPPAVTALEPVLLSVADVSSAMKVDRDSVKSSTTDDALHDGLNKLTLCADGTVRGDAIGAHSSNSYWVDTGQYPYLGSAVAGFYGDAADPFLDAVRTSAERCGWRPFTVPKLGQESFGITAGDGSDGVYAMIFVRSGQVLFQVAIQNDYTTGSYQSDLIKMATSMAKRLPKPRASR